MNQTDQHDNSIMPLFLNSMGLDCDGTDYLVSRHLSVTIARRMGIASRNRKIYFAYPFNNHFERYKVRSIDNKKDMFFNSVKDKSYELPFWNQKNFKDNSYLIVTEGEFDAIAIAQLGFENVVSLPNGVGGAESTFRNYYDYIQKFELIYLCLDMDNAGNEACKKLKKMIPPSKYRRIHLPCKDANEWIIEEDPTKEDFEDLMLNAERITSDNIMNFKDVPEEHFNRIDLGCSTGWVKLDNVVAGLRRGEVTVVSADTGSGKTTFCISLLYNVANQSCGIWINSYEMDPKIVTRKLASKVLQKKMKFQDFTEEDKFNYLNWLKNRNCYLNPSNSKADLPTLRKQIELASLAYDANYILIDHLDYISSSGQKQYNFENIDDAVREIHSLAMEFKVHIILVVHPKQTQNGMITMADLKGSAGIKQYADNIILLARMGRIHNDPKDNRVLVNVCKNRLVGKEGQFYLRYIEETDSYIENVLDN